MPESEPVASAAYPDSRTTVARHQDEHVFPFAWQHGRSLFLLNQEGRSWTVAELRFEDSALQYEEIRRATYLWPREAAGFLLARGYGLGDDSVEELATHLDSWLGAHQSDGTESGSENSRLG